MSDKSQQAELPFVLIPELFDHPVGQLAVRETHISWIVLTGDYAYKIKKPVNLGFADFSTLERRHRFCQEELRLNGRFSEDLYLSVVPLSQRGGRLRFGAAGPPVEYAVRMRQFDERDLLSRLMADGKLDHAHIDQLAGAIADFHAAAAPAADETDWGSLAQVGGPAFDNFAVLKPLIDDCRLESRCDELANWTRQSHSRLADVFAQRRQNGFIRECHGDLHLGNVVIWRGKVTPFDCIEFNPALRWIDVMSELAFVVMDLDDHGRRDFGWRFLNASLEQTGDYGGLAVLPFYLVYRAMVRAKVGALRLQQPGLSRRERREVTDQWHSYLGLAEQYTAARQPRLTITRGVSGSGKTTGTHSLVEEQGAIRIRSDIERKRLFHREAAGRFGGAVEGDIYTPDATGQTYRRLADLARAVILAGFPVIVDATFLHHGQRSTFRDLADELHVPFEILEFEASESELRRRIQNRMNSGADASDATLAVLAHQLQTQEPLTEQERTFTVRPH